MKVVDKTVGATKQTTLNDVPVGGIFRGDVWGTKSGYWTTGIFYKANGPSGVRGKAGTGENTADVLVVRLDSTEAAPNYANVYLNCSVVRNYELLDVELVIKGVL